MTQEEIEAVIKNHRLWLEGKGGQRATLSNATLSNAIFRHAILSNADLSGAYLSGANLSGANLSGANLSGANLRFATLSNATLSNATLSNATLSGANLSGAYLSGANLSGATLIYCIGNGRQIKSMQIDSWSIVWTNADLAIGCKQFPIKKWLSMSTAEIVELDPQAGDFAVTYGDIIKTLVTIK